MWGMKMWWLYDKDDYLYQFLTPNSLLVAAAAVTAEVKWPDVVFLHAVCASALTKINSCAAEHAGASFAFSLGTFHYV